MKDVKIGNYYCFLDRGYKDTICIVDLRMPEGKRQRDLFTWNREKFDKPRGTERNKLNVPMETVIEAFNVLNVKGFNYGKKAHATNVTATKTDAVNNTTANNANSSIVQAVIQTMIQNERIHQERYNQTQERLNQLSEQNITLMNLVSTLLDGNNTTLYNINTNSDCIDTVSDSNNTNSDCIDTVSDSNNTNSDCIDTTNVNDDLPVIGRKKVKRETEPAPAVEEVADNSSDVKEETPAVQNKDEEEVVEFIPDNTEVIEEQDEVPVLTRKTRRR